MEHDRFRARVLQVALRVNPDGGQVRILDGGSLAGGKRCRGGRGGNLDGERFIEVVFDRPAIQVEKARGGLEAVGPFLRIDPQNHGQAFGRRAGLGVAGE
jgi:hypothetical protein